MFALSFEFFEITDLKAGGGGGGLELYDAEAPLLDECARLDTLNRRVVLKGRLGPSTPSTAPNRRCASCRWKCPESSGKKARLSCSDLSHISAGSTCPIFET